MLVTRKRPRVLEWFHAGPLLYGDWGTSRLYVLGLAFFYTSHASFGYLAAIGMLMAVVAWAYVIVCRSYPDGGGVYTAARELNPTLSVVGATLLLCGYIMTAAISVVEALHYFGVPHDYVLVLSILIIALVGGVNWLGAKSAGTFALIIAFAALVVSAILAIISLPYIPKGIGIAIENIGEPFKTPWPSWVIFTKICLALAGVEAVANMTGLMKEPVGRTAKRTLLPVLIEVVALNLFFVLVFLAMQAQNPVHLSETLPEAKQALVEVNKQLAAVDSKATLGAEQFAALTAQAAELTVEIHHAREIRDTAMEVLAVEAGQNAFGTSVGFGFGKFTAIVFGLLLLSATNTAVMAMVSVLFSMAQDRELPHALTKLNYSGVPWVGLIVAVVVPSMILLYTLDVGKLAELYIIGVCGAITTNVLCCAVNRKLQIKSWERFGLSCLGLFLLAVTVTIVFTKPDATIFAGIVVGSVLVVRQGLAIRRNVLPEPMPLPKAGWLAQIGEKIEIDPNKPRIMLAARGRYQAEFAIDMARRRNATLFVMYVRTLRVMDLAPGGMPSIEDDESAQEALGSVIVLGKQYGVPVVPIYVCSTEIADEILDYTVTYGCDTLVLGKSRRRRFSRAIEGDVVSRIARHLPDGVALITRDADPHPIGPPLIPDAVEFAEPEDLIDPTVDPHGDDPMTPEEEETN